ncbi:hypothetical protein MHM98_10135 [Psychrobium sp. MM17-31]|uniref:hypothetical protein n=1 Tax=Psychrobium sp. MM17-31 TaxID=2917758 RepID=UPI001EF6E281|nr:hypothetical protein [Psychrobium sp. MM17-31]MCG7531699.1 hypothetical protein [Psychrobium sp. MM17-31]
MRQTIHYFSIAFLALLLIACSGGNKLSNSSDGDGDGGTTPTQPTSVVSLTMTDNDGNSVTNVDGSQPRWLTATYTVDNKAVANKKVVFSLDGDIGQLLVTSALTNSEGVAKVEIFAGNTVGAGTATVTIDDLTDSLDFSTSNPVAVIEPVNLTIKLVDDSGASIKNVSSIEPAKLEATLTHSGSPTAGVKVTFALADDIGELKTTSALTDDNGIASVLLYSGAQDGAGTVSAAVGDVNASLDFSASVAAVNVEMGDLVLTPTSIGPNGTASLSVPINESVAGTVSPLAQSVNVQFSSACVTAGKAEIASEVATVNGVATVTYKDKGCGAVDKINVTSTIGQTVLTKNVDLTVGAAALQSIQFTEVTSNFIALKGTGGAERSETATVTFTVFDELGAPVSDTLVNFALTTNVGGIEIRPESQAKTDANGRVDVIVSSGSIAVPVRVVASLDAFPTISTVSGALSISTGVADYNSFSVAASNLNPDAWGIDNVEVDITARLADHFNNPVPDGTTVQFSTEYGAVDSNCLTENGTCTVKWRSQAPRTPSPAYRDANAITRTIGTSLCLNSAGVDTGLSQAGLPCFYGNTRTENRFGGLGQVYGNRITIFAHVLGEESFADSNGSGQFNAGEAFTDLPEAFRDENEDGVFGGRLANGDVVAGASDTGGVCYGSTAVCFEPGGDNEEFIDLNSNNTFDLGNNKYNGVLCSVDDDAAGICSRELVSISKNITILQAGSGIQAGLIEAGLDRDNPANYGLAVDISGGAKTIHLYAAGAFNGLLPSGTTITFDAGNGEIVGPSECTVGQSSAYAINHCSVSVKPDDEASAGSLTATIETPSGVARTLSVSVSD